MPKRLLLIDPIPTHRIRLRAALRAAQYDIVSIDRIACAAGAMATAPIDLVLLNTSGADPAQMMTRLRKVIGSGDVPVLCRDDDSGPLRRMQALSTGARGMVATRVPDALLLARLRGLLRDAEAAMELERRRVAAASFGFRETAKPFEAVASVSCVSLGTPPLEDLSRVKVGSNRILGLTRQELLRDHGGGPAPDAIILNMGSDASDELDDVLPEIRMRSHLRQSSVIVVHPAKAYGIAVRALNLGAAEVIEQGSTEIEVAHRIETVLSRKRVSDTLRRSAEESFRWATTDALTGLFNRRYAEIYLSDALTHSLETGRCLAVMMVDIDYFKAVNDTFGHSAGDRVLKEVASRIRDNLRAVDLVSRHGGEEFLVILPETDHAEVELAAERLRMRVGNRPIYLADGKSLEVTVSIGVAVTSSSRKFPARTASHNTMAFSETHGETRSVIDLLLESADEALYRAKDAGRNCVAISPTVASAA